LVRTLSSTPGGSFDFAQTLARIDAQSAQDRAGG
jgi:hypothetical protein